MAVYKVPQDVEADDKLLGPFTFRQFIYLIIVVMAGGMAYLLSKVFIGLVIVPLPVIIFFGALALPLKKDQPMEAYLGALVSFYFLKPRKRFWTPDGLNELVEITAPRIAEPERIKDISGYEARARLGYLTDIVESRGWAVRGAGVPTHGVTSMNNDAYQEAQAANDMLDDSNGAAQKFDQLIERNNEQSREQLMKNVQSQSTPTPVIQAAAPLSSTQISSTATDTTPANVMFNPYPNNIKQSIIQPLGEPASSMTTNTSTKPPSPDIIKLANDSEGLSVAAIAQQAHRIETAQSVGIPTQPSGLSNEEVQISLR